MQHTYTHARIHTQLALSKQLAALQKRFSVTDEQLTNSKGDLRSARRDNEKLQLENEELLRRIHAAHSERAHATKQVCVYVSVSVCVREREYENL